MSAMDGPVHCPRCPFRDDPGTPCAAEVEGDDTWCHRINPARAIWTRDAVDRLRLRTYELLGRPAPPGPTAAEIERAAVLARRAKKRRIPLGVKVAPGRR